MLASAGISRDSCGAQDDDKRNVLHQEGVLVTVKESQLQIFGMTVKVTYLYGKDFI
jgi:hypothetical protein